MVSRYLLEGSKADRRSKQGRKTEAYKQASLDCSTFHTLYFVEMTGLRTAYSL